MNNGLRIKISNKIDLTLNIIMEGLYQYTGHCFEFFRKEKKNFIKVI